MKSKKKVKELPQDSTKSRDAEEGGESQDSEQESESGDEENLGGDCQNINDDSEGEDDNDDESDDEDNKNDECSDEGDHDVQEDDDYSDGDEEKPQKQPNTVLDTCEEAVEKKKKRKVHQLSMTQTEDFNAKLKRRGVVYVARIPPRMTPTKLKKMLQEISQVEITRLYLVEEDAAVRKRRRKEGGNGSKRYVEGWVEFASKSVAKHVAASLNNTPITNQKRNHHYGDLWNLKYLHKFQWSHLTEKVAYERRVKEQKLRLETMQARKETAAYKQLVETGKKLDKIQERKRRREAKQGTSQSKKDHEDPHASAPKKRRAKQVQPLDDGAGKSTHHSLLGSLV